MAHNERPGPLPPHDSKTSIPRLANRFAKRDPQLYPLAAIMAVTLCAAGYFLLGRAPGAAADQGAGPVSAVQSKAAILHDASKGKVSLEDFKAGKTSGIPHNVGAPNTMRTHEVPLSEGANPKVQTR